MVKNSGDCGSRQAVETVFSGGRRWWWFSWWSYSEVLWRLWSRACTSAEIRLSDRAKITLASNFLNAVWICRCFWPVTMSSSTVAPPAPAPVKGMKKNGMRYLSTCTFFILFLVSNLGPSSPQARTGTMTRNLSAPTPA